MSPLKKWSCWEIIKCKNFADCPVSQQNDLPCWEITKELEDYRSALNICKDCLVFVSRQRDSVLSTEDIQKIVETKTDCVLKTRCTRFASGE